MHIETCGKFILAGEHFILHGTAALALPWHQATLRLLPTSTPSEISPKLLEIWRTACAHVGLATPTSFPFEIRSNIPQGCGFGSSAALCVAMACQAALLAKTTWEDQALIAFATRLESTFHGRSSGLDPTIVVTRRPLRVVMGHPNVPIRWDLKGCGFVLAVSREKRQTAQAVGKVHDFSIQHPKIFRGLVQEVHSLLASIEALISGEGLYRSSAHQERARLLGEQLTHNHEHLRTVGVSSPHLEQLIDAAMSAGALGAKLTGAGMGGGMLALAPLSQLSSLAQSLRKAGALNASIYDPNVT